MAGTITAGGDQGAGVPLSQEASNSEGQQPLLPPQFTPWPARPPLPQRPSRIPDGIRRIVHHRWTTPAVLRTALACCLALTVAFGALCAVIPLHTGGSWSSVEQQLAPQVRDASDLYLALTDMDAQTANILVFGDDKSLAAHRAQAVTLFGRDRDDAGAALQGATVSGGSNASAQAALVQILDGLGKYEELSSRATSLNDEAKAPAGHPAPAALAAYRQATDLMRSALLPSAEKLITADNATFTSTYGGERGLLSGLRLAALALGLLTLAALVALQLLLARRFRRRINPALAAATLLCVTVLVWTFTLAGDERYQLYYARHEAFDSVVALSAARAVGYDANADESRNILDPQRSGGYSQAFLDKSQQIAGVNGASLATYPTGIAEARQAYLANHDDLRFTGYLGTEFRNITFQGERAAAEKALAAWVRYERDDHTTRDDLAAGRQARAIAFNTSWAVGGSNYHFGQWDTAMQADVTINANAFASAVSDGRGELDTALVVIVAGTGLALTLAAVGVRPRLAEFR